MHGGGVREGRVGGGGSGESYVSWKREQNNETDGREDARESKRRTAGKGEDGGGDHR